MLEHRGKSLLIRHTRLLNGDLNMNEHQHSKLRAALGLITLIAIIIIAYFSYKTLAYILNWETPQGDVYRTYMQTLIYVLFALTAAFILCETFEKWEK